MATTRQDVTLVFGGGGGSGDITATPPGSSLNGIIQSGFPAFQGVAQPQVDLFLDFNDGTDVNTLGINLAGSTTDTDVVAFNNTKIYRKHEWIPTGGFDGGGFIRMHWFTGMQLGFSPVMIQLPGGFTPHYLVNYKVRQSTNMVHQGSAVKLLRQVDVNAQRSMGTIEWENGGVGAGQFQRMRLFFDDFAIAPPATPNRSTARFCVWDDIADPGASCSPKVDGLIDGGWHDWTVEFDYRNPAAPTIAITIDGVFGGIITMNAEADADGGPNIIPPLGSRFDMSPFAETYSCGPQGCQATINTGDFDVDHFSYTILP